MGIYPNTNFNNNPVCFGINFTFDIPNDR